MRRHALLTLFLGACSGRDSPTADPAAHAGSSKTPDRSVAARAQLDRQAMEADIVAHALDGKGAVPAALRRVPAPVEGSSSDARTHALAGAWLIAGGDKLLAFGFEADGRVRIWDDGEEVISTLALDGPCTFALAHEGTELRYAFALHDGVAVFGSGIAGQLEHDEAVICDRGTYHLDRAGRCSYVKPFTHEAVRTVCSRGVGVVTYVDPVFRDKQTLNIAGDVLWTEQLAKTHAQPNTDYATAVALARNTPAAIAIRAGGHIGETSSIAGLVASVAVDRTLMGHLVEVSGNVLSPGSSVMNGERTNYIYMNTPADTFHPSVTCFTRDSPLDTAPPGHTIRVSGRVARLTPRGDVELRPCAIVK